MKEQKDTVMLSEDWIYNHTNLLLNWMFLREGTGDIRLIEPVALDSPESEVALHEAIICVRFFSEIAEGHECVPAKL